MKKNYDTPNLNIHGDVTSITQRFGFPGGPGGPGGNGGNGDNGGPWIPNGNGHPPCGS